VLAESFTPNADFTAWTLKLKPDIVFSDGTPYDAAAVKANWDREKDPANRSPSFTGLLSVGELTVTDPLTLEIPLTSPNAQFPNTVARAGLNYIASATAISSGTDLTSQAVGAGPFTLESWTRDDRMIMNANPDWKGSDGPYLEKLTFRVVGDEEQRLDTFNTGDADAFYTATPDTVDRAMEAVDGAEYTSVEVTTGQTIVFNNAKPPFDDIRMRTAYAQAVDWQGLADAVFGPGSVAPYNFTLEGTDFYTPDAELPPYDPEAAQALIDEYVAEKGGPVTINQLAFQQSLDQARGEFIQTALSQLDNIEFSLTVNDSPTNIGLVLAGDYMVSSWGFPVVAADPGPYNSAFSQALTNYSKYSNPDVDAALLEARATDDKATQTEAIQRVFTQLAKDIPYYPYVETANGFVTSPELHGTEVYEDGILRTDLLWKDG
jgi:peptide/nickel transport system substrate-binding protein